MFPASYVNVALNTSACTGQSDMDCKFVVDDRPGSENGMKIVATSMETFESALLFAGNRLKLIKLKGEFSSSMIERLCNVLERHLPDSQSLTAFNMKMATFEDSDLSRAALGRMAVVVLSLSPPSLVLTPAKKVDKLLGEFVSSDELVQHLTARCTVASADIANPALRDPRAAKLKFKAGCLDGASPGYAWLDDALRDLRTPNSVSIVKLPLPSDAVCCAAAAAGEWPIRVGPVAGIKVRGRLSDKAVALVLHTVRTVPTVGKISLVRYETDSAAAALFVPGLCDAAVGRSASLDVNVVKKTIDGKLKQSWHLAGGDSAPASVREAMATFIS